MAITRGWMLQEAICKAVGLDIRRDEVRKITVVLPHDGPMMVTIERYPIADQEQALVHVFESTEFRERVLPDDNMSPLIDKIGGA